MSAEVEHLSKLLRPARRVLVFTGAGVSTGSGIPDYRGPQGVWNTRRPVEFADFMSSPEARLRYWTQKSEDWEAYRDVRPNPAHEAIVHLEQAGRLRLLVTQNIDGLHRRAGSSADKTIEVHGTNARVECMSCHRSDDADPYYRRFQQDPTPPLCPCGGPLKPATISFGQPLREADLDAAWAAARDSDLVIALGSTLAVTPAAHVPLMAARNGAPYVICNRGPTEHDGRPELSLRIDGDVAQTFAPAVDAALAEDEPD